MQSLDRAVQVLDVLSKSADGMPITELSDRIGLSLSTTHRFLQSLSNNDLVVQDPISRRYKLGLRLLSLASGLLKSDRLLELSRETMQRAAVLSGNVVYLCKQQIKKLSAYQPPILLMTSSRALSFRSATPFLLTQALPPNHFGLST